MGREQDGRGPSQAPAVLRRLGVGAVAVAVAVAVLAGWPPQAWTDEDLSEAAADAATLVRQALVALEATPPNLDVASDKLADALRTTDTRGVDMPRVREAAQALGLHDPLTAASLLVAAVSSSPAEAALLVPYVPRSPDPLVARTLLGAAAFLVLLGMLIVVRS